MNESIDQILDNLPLLVWLSEFLGGRCVHHFSTLNEFWQIKNNDKLNWFYEKNDTSTSKKTSENTQSLISSTWSINILSELVRNGPVLGGWKSQPAGFYCV